MAEAFLHPLFEDEAASRCISSVSPAIRSSCVKTLPGLDDPDVCPSPDLISRLSLSSTGSLGEGSPASQVLRRAPTPRCPSPTTSGRLVLLAWRIPLTRSDSLPRAGAALPRARVLGFGSTPRAAESVEATGPPRFLGNHLAYAPRSTTPPGPGKPRSTPSPRCCLPFRIQRRLPKKVISELNHAARTLAVYASQRGLPQRHARLATSW